MLDLSARRVYDGRKGVDTVTHDEIIAIPFRDLLRAMGLTQTACSRRFDIPLRTVQGWANETRRCPVYIRLMMAELTGILKRTEG